MNKNNIIKFNDMKNHSATDKQLKYINDLCSDNGYEFYNQDINMKQVLILPYVQQRLCMLKTQHQIIKQL